MDAGEQVGRLRHPESHVSDDRVDLSLLDRAEGVGGAFRGEHMVAHLGQRLPQAPPQVVVLAGDQHRLHRHLRTEERGLRTEANTPSQS
jgi:hypothetical protein